MKPMRLRFEGCWQKPMLPLALLLTLVLAPQSVFAKAPATLSFNVAVRVQADSGKDAITRSNNARVFLRGEQTRIETKVGQQSIVVLYLKPYVYRLLPASKAGVRYKSSTPSPELEALAANWPSLMNQPSKIRAVLKQKGAKKTGTATINGTATDIYVANRWDGKPRKIKLWLRRSDNLPVRMESNADGIKATLNWSNYRKGQTLSSLLFAVPKSYKIRESSNSGSMR